MIRGILTTNYYNKFLGDNMKIQNIKTLEQILYLLKFVDNKKALKLLNEVMDCLLNNKELNNLELLKLNDYYFIQNDYHIIKDIFILIEETFNINKYNDIINVIRVNNYLGYDKEYLNKLFNELKLENKYVKGNSRTEGLFNLLNDNNLIYNNVGLRILIVKYLLGRDLTNLKVFNLSNNRLNDNVSFLTFKNDKIKFYSKLYFINDNIVLSTLEHDNIVNVVYTFKNNIDNDFYGGYNENIKNEDNTTTNDIREKQYRYFDKEEKLLENINRLLNNLNNFFKVDIILNSLDNNLMLSNVLNIFKDNEDIIFRYDKLSYLYENIIKGLKDIDNFKSNSIELKEDTFSNDFIISGNNYHTVSFKKRPSYEVNTNFNYKVYL